MPAVAEIDKLYRVERDIHSRVVRVKTPKNWWFRLRSFEGYARDLPTMSLFLLRLLADIRDGRRYIPLKHKSLKLGPMVPNAGQMLVWDAMLEQSMALQPVRIIIPKARRQGVSTAIDITFDYLCWHIVDRKAMIVAHQDDSAKAIFETVLQSHAKYIETNTKKPCNWQSLPKTKIEYEKSGSSFRLGTAMGRFKGSGGTLSYLHVSEAGKFDQTSEQDKKAMRSILNSVTKDDPETIIAIESSGQGPSGDFYRRVKAAFGSLEKKDGAEEDEEDNTAKKFRGVFLPWTLDKMCNSTDPKCPETFEGFRPKPSGYENKLIKDFNVTPRQLMWRREELQEEGVSDYGENPAEWAWEWPLEWADCFRGKSGLVYPQMVRRHPKCQIIPDEYFSNQSYHAHAIDWGQSKNSPFVCLWIRVDPTKDPALIVSPECESTWDELESYQYDERTNQPRKENDHAMDAIRYFISTNKIRGLAYVYREYFERSFGEQSGVGALAKAIHERQGWRPAPGAAEMDLAKYIPSGHAVREFQNGVMDRAAGLAIIGQFCHWQIPVAGYRPPSEKDTGKNAVSAGIAMVSALCSGNVILDTLPIDPTEALARAAARKLRSQREWPTDEEFAAYERVRDERLGELAAVNTKRLTSTGWREICG